MSLMGDANWIVWLVLLIKCWGEMHLLCTSVPLSEVLLVRSTMSQERSGTYTQVAGFDMICS